MNPSTESLKMSKKFLQSWCKENDYVFGSKVKAYVISVMSELLDSERAEFFKEMEKSGVFYGIPFQEWYEVRLKLQEYGEGALPKLLKRAMNTILDTKEGL